MPSTPKEMTAAVFGDPQRGIELRPMPMPQPGPGEVLVRVAACGVCHTDLHYLDHGVPTFLPPPIILGHEASGTVEALGPEVTAPPPGTPVLIPPVLSCGTCVACRLGRENICGRMSMYGNHRHGAFAPWVTAPAKDVHALPPELPLAEACVLADAVATPFHAVVRRARVAPGDWVAVVGAGGVGINVVQIAAAIGARIFVVERDEQRARRARDLGAQEAALAGDEKALVRRVREWSGGGVEIAFECVGRPETIALAHALLRPGGRLCLVGYSEAPAPLAVAKIMFFEQEIVGSLGCRPVDFPRVIEMARTRRIQLEPLITLRVPLERITEALDHVRTGAGLRAIVTP